MISCERLTQPCFLSFFLSFFCISNDSNNVIDKSVRRRVERFSFSLFLILFARAREIFFLLLHCVFSTTQSRASAKMVFTVIVHLDVKSEHVEKVKAKLIEASRTYVKDKGTIDWFVSQGKKSVLFCYLEEDTIFHSKTDVTDPTKFALVERYEQQSDLQTHIDNPYYKQFGAYVKPLLSKPLVCYYLNCYNSLLIVFDVTRNFTR